MSVQISLNHADNASVHFVAVPVACSPEYLGNLYNLYNLERVDKDKGTT